MKYGGLGLGLETQRLGLGLDKKVLFTSLYITKGPNSIRAVNAVCNTACTHKLLSNMPL